MPDSATTYFFLITSAFFAGAMNSIAGGGTLLTFPSLLSVLGPGAGAIANATSTVALLPGSLAGAVGYRNELKAARGFAVRMFLPSLLGGLLGAWLVGLNTHAFDTLIPWLILTAAALFLIQPMLGKVIRRHATDTHPPGPILAAGLIAAQFLIAVYGGYFGAGIGILMLTALGFMGVGDIHRMNGVKTFLAAVINGASVIIFVKDGLVNWHYAGVMVGAAIVGGYAGARVSRRLPTAVVRWLVIVIGFGLSAKYFWAQYGG